MIIDELFENNEMENELNLRQKFIRCESRAAVSVCVWSISPAAGAPSLVNK